MCSMESSGRVGSKHGGRRGVGARVFKVAWRNPSTAWDESGRPQGALKRIMNPKVDAYIERSTKWPQELSALRSILLDCGLAEELKWGKPCYSHAGANIVILQEMKAFLSLMFFKGALLADPQHVLVEPGPNSRSARRIEFTSARDVARLAKVVSACVEEALRVEADGVQLVPKPQLVLVEELQQRLAQNPRLKTAFEALTPGRRREYNLDIATAKRSSTRLARIDTCASRILSGKGFRD